MTAVAIAVMAAGSAAREPLLVLGGYVLVVIGVGRSRALLRAIDRGDRASDGRSWVFFAWFLSMAGSAIAVILLLRAVLG